MTHAPQQVLVIAHTHWDREWYHTAERFRQRLVELVDELLDDPPAPGTSFLLDGQAVLLDDYLAVRPERAAELAALLRDGRLEAGPWYVLADELIPGGEALVRNLLAGREAVRRLRGEPPPVLYCPDSFGHPAILPELAAGFGCDVIVLWRGYGGARWPAGDTVRWRGPSGAVVLAYHLPPDGYEFGSSLPTDAAAAAARWTRAAEVLLPRAATGVALLLNGADHHARQREQARAVAALEAAAAPVIVRPSTLRDAAAALRAAAARATLPVVAGELRDSHGYTWTLGGTLATRAAQKRRNALAERTLVRDVEPWVALAGGDAAIANLRAAWRDVLRCHPHDTLCGTSIDAVAEAMDQRLATVEAQAAGLRDDALASLVGHDAERARGETVAWRPALLVRNPTARRRGGVAALTVQLKVADVAVGPGSGARQGAATEPVQDLAAVGMQVLARHRRVALTESPRAYPKAELVEEVAALAWVDAMDGYTVRTHSLDAPGLGVSPHPVRVDEAVLDNGILRVSVSAQGAVRVEELGTGRIVEDAVALELHRDAGDLYTPAIRERLAAPAFDGCDVVHRGPLRGELALRFAGEEGASRVTLRLQLDAALGALRIAVQGVNALRDARLRVLFGGSGGAENDDPEAAGVNRHEHRSAAAGVRGGPPTGNIASEAAEPNTISPAVSAIPRTVADAAFHPVVREPFAISPAEAAMEHVVPAAPLHRYVSRYGDTGFTVISDGLAEYEALEDGRIAVTLLRAVGELSRHDLPERPGHAGWPAATPGAQSQGPFAASFAVALHGPDTPAQRDAIERLADDVLLPLTGHTLRANLLPPRVVGGITLEGDGLAFSAALPASQAGCVVLRCVNRRDERVEGRWRLGCTIAEAWLARLDETRLAPLAVSGGVVAFPAEPMAIVTIVARLPLDTPTAGHS